MASQNLMDFGMDVLKTTASTMAVTMTVGPTIERMSEGNLIKQSVGDGLGFALSSDIVDYFTSGRSKILNMQWASYANDILFFGAVAAAGNVTEIDQKVVNFVGDMSPINSEEINLALAKGLFVSTARVAGNYIDANSPSNSVLHYIKHPLTLVGVNA